MRSQWIADVIKHWRHRRFVRCHFTERLPGIRDALGVLPEGGVLLAGNSHAEFLGTSHLAGRPCVNLGVGGSTAADCAVHLAHLRPPVRAAAAVLFIGTNDILRWRHPERARAEARFETEVRRILETLGAWSAHVFVAAVPPIGAWATSRDPGSVATFSARLQTLCAEGGHTFFDPFAAMRDAGPGLARTGLHRDGVHMADYPWLAAEIGRFVGLRLVPSRAHTPRTEAVSSILIARALTRTANPTFSATVRAAARPRGPLKRLGTQA